MSEPSPHEDFTIRQLIVEMRKDKELRQKVDRVPPKTLDAFLQKWGQEHPSNYQAKTGKDWRETLFGSTH